MDMGIQYLDTEVCAGPWISWIWRAWDRLRPNLPCSSSCPNSCSSSSSGATTCALIPEERNFSKKIHSIQNKKRGSQPAQLNPDPPTQRRSNLQNLPVSPPLCTSIQTLVLRQTSSRTDIQTDLHEGNIHTTYNHTYTPLQQVPIHTNRYP